MKKKIKIIFLSIISVLVLIPTSLLSFYLIKFNPKNYGDYKTRYKEPYKDKHFIIKQNNSKNIFLRPADRYVQVFGLRIYSAPDVPNSKILHAANVLAQYIDNDGDLKIDNSDVYMQLRKKQNLIFMHLESKSNYSFLQNLTAEETVPSWHNDKSQRFDASLEEIWHAITTSGYALVYPKIFGEDKNSELSKAMDIARGGYFKDIPNEYPQSAWYTYKDKTCNYGCQNSEYFYWLMSSKLGAQSSRADEIGDEWKLNTPQRVKEKDLWGWKIINNPQYKLPTKLPNGKYNGYKL